MIRLYHGSNVVIEQIDLSRSLIIIPIKTNNTNKNE